MVRLGISQQDVRTEVMETQNKRKALINSTRKEKIKDLKGTLSLNKIAHNLMKIMIVKKKPMRKYCLWPITLKNRYQTKNKKG